MSAPGPAAAAPPLDPHAPYRLADEYAFPLHGDLTALLLFR
jgi:hypothetical protein